MYFQNVCLEDNSIILKDESQKIVLNTKGIMDDLSEELLEFLKYVEDSSEETVKNSKGNLVKNIHKKVEQVKNDKLMEVEFMTLLERDREKIEEGIEKGIQEGIKKGLKEGIEKKAKETAIKAINMGMDNGVVAELTGLKEEEINEIRKEISH